MMIPPREPDDPRNSDVLLRRRLLEEGWNDRAIRRRLADRSWVKLRHGAYLPTPIWDQLDESGRHGLLARAVQLQASTEVVLSHVSGLPEYDAPTWGLDLSEVHVTRKDDRTGRREAGVCQHCGTIEEGDVVTRNGVEVMSATRLALEVTTIASVEASLCVVNYLLHAGATTPEALARRNEKMTHWPHTLSTDLVLRLADPRIESVGESRSFHLCFRYRLPMPKSQYEVRDESGQLLGRVDFAWPEHKVFLEFDGKVKYEKLLKPGERASDVVIREKRREELICRRTGWRCIRITWADLEDPERTAAAIRSLLFPSLGA
ncbi:hypothetical protein [Nocardioides sp. W7]|uniref:hypothetical protein n=1 Tax=Nocardioides sp. W7 TaxID=2931390 RepID=UPI001FD0BFBA|nr:hypothetical protein [Nocardioides sp. W7]